MDESAKLLYQKYLETKKLGWIRSLRNNSSGIGYTFETLIGKKEENFCYPDFQGIEIKTKHNFSVGFLTLLSLVPDGDYLFPLDTIREKYGYPDKTFPKSKIFNFSIQNGMENQLKNIFFELSVDRSSEKIYLVVKDKNQKIIDQSISWSFASVKEKLFLKISFLAVVHANHKYIDNQEYLQYTKIDFYKIKDFEVFLRLIEQGVIRITFRLGIFKSGPREGQKHDHGTSFDINLRDITLLFDKWCIE